jgi:2-oxoglutarate ferredoxin oxidoreductase subunit beta
MDATGTIDFIPPRHEITTCYDPGITQDVTMHDGGIIQLCKDDETIDITNRRSAIDALERHREKGHLLTGLFHVNDQNEETHRILKTTDKPLNSLTEEQLCPGNDTLGKILENYR